MVDRGLAAMARLGEQLRLRRRRHTLIRRAAGLAGLGMALVVTIAVPMRPWFVWNISPSAPIGLYGVRGTGDLAADDMVIAQVPERWRSFAARRRYIPANVPLVKRVAAAPGDRVCALGARILVGGRVVALRRTVDAAGRPMPRWTGCVTLRGGALLLLMDDPASFDGRYFGPSAHGDIVGRAVPLWTWNARGDDDD